MATFAFDHIHPRSPDPDETAAFYERMFGATVIRSTKGAAFAMEATTIRPGTRTAFLRGPENVSIELVDRNA